MKKLFDEIPYLEGERVILRKITEDDRETLQEMARSNNIYRYEPTYLLEQQYDDMDLLLRDLYGKYFENKQKAAARCGQLPEKAEDSLLSVTGCTRQPDPEW